jgi:hypothetical protein
MKILGANIPKLWLIGICVAAILVGGVIGQTISVWSNVSHTEVTSTPYIPDQEHPIQLDTPSTILISEKITLTATINPIPTQHQHQQTVTFYYSKLSTLSKDTPTGTDPLTEKVPMGSAVTVNGVCQVQTGIMNAEGMYYFIAEIANPT